METSDKDFIMNRDWDPSYLAMLFSQDFYNFNDHWNSSNVSDMELSCAMNNLDIYQPIVEDISVDDDVLVDAVEQIEKE